MSRSPLVSIEAGELTPHQFKRRGQHTVTFDELGEELRSLAKSVLDAFGPIAIMQGELMLRQQCLEDAITALNPELGAELARRIEASKPKEAPTTPDSPEVPV